MKKIKTNYSRDEIISIVSRYKNDSMLLDSYQNGKNSIDIINITNDSFELIYLNSEKMNGSIFLPYTTIKCYIIEFENETIIKYKWSKKAAWKSLFLLFFYSLLIVIMCNVFNKKYLLIDNVNAILPVLIVLLLIIALPNYNAYKENERFLKKIINT